MRNGGKICALIDKAKQESISKICFNEISGTSQLKFQTDLFEEKEKFFGTSWLRWSENWKHFSEELLIKNSEKFSFSWKAKLNHENVFMSIFLRINRMEREKKASTD